jgi:hypothetical protein
MTANMTKIWRGRCVSQLGNFGGARLISHFEHFYLEWLVLLAERKLDLCVGWNGSTAPVNIFKFLTAGLIDTSESCRPLVEGVRL